MLYKISFLYNYKFLCFFFFFVVVCLFFFFLLFFFGVFFVFFFFFFFFFLSFQRILEMNQSVLCSNAIDFAAEIRRYLCMRYNGYKLDALSHFCWYRPYSACFGVTIDHKRDNVLANKKQSITDACQLPFWWSAALNSDWLKCLIPILSFAFSIK